MRARAAAPAAGAGIALIMLTALTQGAPPPFPRRPDVACAAPEVTAAFVRCLGGPAPACCAGLDAVFANASSPANGCLCLPQVLFTVITRAWQAGGLDVLRLLGGCRRLVQQRPQPQPPAQAAPPFATQWAGAAPSSCPRVPLDASAADLATALGPASLLPGPDGPASSRPDWAWANLLQTGELLGLADGATARALADRLVGLPVVQLLLVVFIATPGVFGASHAALLWRSAAYRALPVPRRLVCAQHLSYALVFGLSIVPQTLLAVRFMFGAMTGTYLASGQVPLLVGLFIGSRCALYLVEACVRCVVAPSWLLLVHHELFFLTIILALWCVSPPVLALGIVLDLFACHEAPLYVSLLGYRLGWRRALVSRIMAGALAYYFACRVVQTALLLGLIIGFSGMPFVRLTPAFIVSTVLAGALTIVQAVTVWIYARMLAKLSRGGGSEAGSQAGPRAAEKQPEAAVAIRCTDSGELSVAGHEAGCACKDAAQAGRGAATV